MRLIIMEHQLQSLRKKALTNNVAILTTGTPHGFAVGATVAVSGVDPEFDGLRTITAVTSTTLRFASTGTNMATATIQAGVVQLSNRLTLGITHYYRVSIVTGSIESERSTEVSATPALSSSRTFESTGAVQTFTVPVNVNKSLLMHLVRVVQEALQVLVVAGGEAQGAFTVTPGEVLYVYVGGKGGGSLTSTLNLGGWNGGATVLVRALVAVAVAQQMFVGHLL
jgi:hypothetical protein